VRALIQRVSHASVTVDNVEVGKIKLGLLVFLGISSDDSYSDIDYLVHKLKNLRIFNDASGRMNLSISEVNGSFLVISQFTLFASTKKGNRPSFVRAGEPEKAAQLFNDFVSMLESSSNLQVETGRFGEDMQVDLSNSGPVTIILDSKLKEY
jgi:D-tyrosyl-tRNA(Tyr) deacylase